MALADMAATPPLDEGGDVNAEVAELVEKYGQEAVQGAVAAAGGPPGAEALEGGAPLAAAMGEARGGGVGGHDGQGQDGEARGRGPARGYDRLGVCLGRDASRAGPRRA